MIKCTICGTLNREGSKFCSNCGARVAQASGLICPMCGTPNKVESVFCEKCGARLVPLTAAPASDKTPPAPPIKGLSLPAKPLEPPPAPAPEPPPAEEPAPTDWLARLRSATPAEEETPSAEIEAESPEEQAEVEDWLARLRAAPPIEEETPAKDASPIAPDESETPDWLRPAPASPAMPTQEPEPTRTDEMPDWLKRLRDEAKPAKSPEPTPSTHADETPEWLEHLRAESVPAEESAPTIDAQVPDWLRDTSAPADEPTASEPVLPIEAALPTEPASTIEPPLEITPPPQMPAPTPISEDEMPDWLKELKPKESAETPAPQEEFSSEPLIESIEATPAPALLAPADEIPAWAIESPTTGAVVDEDLPDWLRTPVPVMPGEPGIVAPAQAAPALEQAQVPDWIAALKPPEQPIADLESETVESVGPLAGLRGVLPLAVAVVEPHAPPKLTKLGARAESALSDSGHFFESILATPAPAITKPAAKGARFALTMRPVIYLLLLLAVLVPFFLPDVTSSSLPVSRVPARAFFEMVEGLPANSSVLVAFDYEASVAGEMDLIAQTLVRHLIQRRVKLVAVSTVETGAQLAQRVLDRAKRETPNYAYGTDYAILYVPGHEAGLTQLAKTGFAANARDWGQRQPLDRLPVMQNVKTLNQVNLIVLLSGSDDRLQLWMEQVRPFKTVPIAAGVSAAVEPRASVYYDAGQLDVMLSGAMGAAQYEVLSKQHDPLAKKIGAAVTNANAQNAAQLVFVGLILLGNLVYWLTRGQGKTK